MQTRQTLRRHMAFISLMTTSMSVPVQVALHSPTSLFDASTDLHRYRGHFRGKLSLCPAQVDSGRHLVHLPRVFPNIDLHRAHTRFGSVLGKHITVEPLTVVVSVALYRAI
jgi:hypothetical protein